MAWVAKYKAYDCARCDYRIGGLSVPLKRINPSGECPSCGGKLKLVRCDHPSVFTTSLGVSTCRTCRQLVIPA